MNGNKEYQAFKALLGKNNSFADSLYRIAGGKGSFYIADTDEHEIDFCTIHVLDDCVFSVLEIEGVDVLADYGLSSGAVANALITVELGKKFTNIQLTSGIVNVNRL